MPVGVARGHDVSARGINRHRRIDREAQIDELVDEPVPALAPARMDLIPETGHLAEAVLLVVLILADGPILDVVVFEEGFEKPVEVRLGLHTHTGGVPKAPEAEYVYKLWMAHGVTTTRDAGSGAGSFILRKKERSAKNEIVAPRIFAYARPGTGTGWEGGSIQTAEKAREWVRWGAEQGIDGLKLGSYDPHIMEALIDEAKKNGLGTMAHLGQNGVARMNVLDAARLGLGAWRNFYHVWMQFLNDYKNAGGRVTTGSDSGFIYKLYGFAYIEEFELLQEAGFHPLEVVRSATLNGALTLHEPKGIPIEFGILRPGLLADLVVVEENPIENFKVLYGTGAVRLNDDTGGVERVGGIKYTIKDGIVYDAKELLADVARMVERDKLAQAAPTTNEN